MRPKLLQWQWQDYADRHRDRGNLLVHIVAVHCAWSGALGLLSGLLSLSPVPLIAGLVLLAGSLAAQGAGHRREKMEPVPFDGPIDFVTRFGAEQFVTFPATC